MKSLENLTKDQELILGALIQAKLKAEAEIESGAERSPERLEHIKQGKKAMGTLVKSNERLVHQIAHKFKRKMPISPDHEELFAEGMVGLANAINKYDPSRGNKFSTVAYHWIHQAISRGVNERYRLVRLPENRVTDYTNIVKLQKQYEETHNDKEILEIISSKMKIKESKIREILNAAASHASLNKTVGEDNESKELHEYVEELNRSDSAEMQVLNGEMNIILEAGISKLDSLEAEIISNIFKLDLVGFERKTATRIKEEQNLSNSDYRKLYNSGLMKIKTHMDSYGVTFDDFFRD